MAGRDRTLVTDGMIKEYFTENDLRKFLHKKVFTFYTTQLDDDSQVNLNDYKLEAVDKVYSWLGSNTFNLDEEFTQPKPDLDDPDAEVLGKNMWLVGAIANIISYRLSKVFALKADSDEDSIKDQYDATKQEFMDIAKGTLSSPVPPKAKTTLYGFLGSGRNLTDDDRDLYRP